MQHAAVLHELLAVVGRHDHDRVVEDAPAPEGVEEAAELVVELPDLRVVQVGQVRRVGRRERPATEARSSSCSVEPFTVPS